MYIVPLYGVVYCILYIVRCGLVGLRRGASRVRGHHSPHTPDRGALLQPPPHTVCSIGTFLVSFSEIPYFFQSLFRGSCVVMLIVFVLSLILSFYCFLSFFCRFSGLHSSSTSHLEKVPRWSLGGPWSVPRSLGVSRDKS